MTLLSRHTLHNQATFILLKVDAEILLGNLTLAISIKCLPDEPSIRAVDALPCL